MRASDFSVPGPMGPTAARLALTRHQQRREQGIPTLGVLVGAPAAAVAVWQDWAESTGRRAAVRDPGNGEEGGRRKAEGGKNPGDGGEPGEAVLFVWRSSAGAAGLARTVERLCRALAAAGGAGTDAPVALTVEPAEAAAFLRDEPFSRSRTLFAEGMVSLPTATPSPLARWALRPETAASFEAATAALRAVDAAPAAAEEDDRARSAAERFLFDLLGDLPETAGLFELNVRLGFCFGPMPAEVDLLAVELRLALEIDGFHHFRDQDGYRRDRRKDALLQRQGFLVLRFLAEDVVVRLEEILEEIRTTVAFRRATRS